MLFNEKISIIRKMNNLTQEEFAEELDVSRQAISKWENGTSVPDVYMLTRISDLYNLTLNQLIRDEYDLPISQENKSAIEGFEEESNRLPGVKPSAGAGTLMV